MKRPRAAGIRVATRRAGLLAAALGTAYLGLLLYPQPLFAYELESAGIVVHATRPIPEAMRTTLARVRERVERTGLVEPGDRFQLFICDPRWLFALFTRMNYQVGGVANVYLRGHVFLRQSDMEHDRLISPAGRPVAADRPLSYFMAHEIMHVVHSRRLGLPGYTRLPRWVDDGHADYAARDVDLARALDGFKSQATELDPARSGLYVRYHLLVAHELTKKGVALGSLLRSPRPQQLVERDVALLHTW